MFKAAALVTLSVLEVLEEDFCSSQDSQKAINNLAAKSCGQNMEKEIFRRIGLAAPAFCKASGNCQPFRPEPN